MLGLKLPTDPRWVNIAEKNIDEILIDHAHCELKAASTANSLIMSFPEYPNLVTEMVSLVKEEMSHFKLVHEKLIARNIKLGQDRKDLYVNKLLKFFPKGGSRTTQLIHRLLYAALIEARSCERFKVFAENMEDEELSKFYTNLMVSEANHYTVFLKFAREYQDREIVDQKWNALVAFEAEMMKERGNSAKIHG